MKDIKQIERITREIREMNSDPVDQNNVTECMYAMALVRETNRLIKGLRPLEVCGALLPLSPDDCMIRLDDWIKSGSELALGGDSKELCELYEKARAAQRKLENLLVKIQKIENPKYVTK